MGFLGQYILNAQGEPMPCEDTLRWAQWMETGQRTLLQTELGRYGWVSTVFLGLDHGWVPMDDPLTYHPVLWETLVFGGPMADTMLRYRSAEEARTGHAEVVGLLSSLAQAATRMQAYRENKGLRRPAPFCHQDWSRKHDAPSRPRPRVYFGDKAAKLF